MHSVRPVDSLLILASACIGRPTWAWLAAETDDLAEKERCLEAILELEPDAEWAQVALQGIRYRQVQMN